MARIAVIDIGKTNAKVLVADPEAGTEEVLARAPNAVLRDGPYPHHDMGRLWEFVLAGLRQAGPVAAISVTTHGASAALVGGTGELALPVLDYEHDGPDRMRAVYEAMRPGFEETGSPALPMGLNLGAQLFWQAREFPEAFARVRHILTLPQYWSFRLSGVAASEYTSLGCHTDLWNPFEGRFSSLVGRMGWEGLFPPVAGPGQVMGGLRPEVAAATGLPQETPVLSGIHDSNASLVPWLGGEGPRAVLSTGTWMIVMALRGKRVHLDARRDLLVNVNARGEPVPTARFMGGREMEEITGGRIVVPSEAELTAVLEAGLMALPSRHPTTGPFPGLEFAWVPGEPGSPGLTAAAASFYAALMGAECLGLIGAEGDIVVEGPFGANSAFLRMLATATRRPVIAAGEGAGTGLGAALLAGSGGQRTLPAAVLPEQDGRWGAYAAAWRERVGREWAGR
jgi:sugar (pentulose or hexulose) kinase